MSITIPENMPDPIRKRFGYGQLWPLRPACSQNRPWSYKFCQIRLRASVSVIFSKKAMYHIVQNRPRSGLDGLHGQGLAKHIWSGSRLVCRNRWARFLTERNRPAPVSNFQNWFRSSTDVPDNIVRNQPGSDLVLADCVTFCPNGSGPEASRCARIIRPASGQCFPASPDRMRIGSVMFTGTLTGCSVL